MCALDHIRDLSPSPKIGWKKDISKCDGMSRGCRNQGRKALHQGNEPLKGWRGSRSPVQPRFDILGSGFQGRPCRSRSSLMSTVEHIERGAVLCQKRTVASGSRLETLAILPRDTGGLLKKTTVMTSLLLGGCSDTGWNRARLRECGIIPRSY